MQPLTVEQEVGRGISLLDALVQRNHTNQHQVQLPLPPKNPDWCNQVPCRQGTPNLSWQQQEEEIGIPGTRCCALMAFQTLHTDEVPRYKPRHVHQTTTEGDTQKVHALPPLRTWHQWEDTLDPCHPLGISAVFKSSNTLRHSLVQMKSSYYLLRRMAWCGRSCKRLKCVHGKITLYVQWIEVRQVWDYQCSSVQLHMITYHPRAQTQNGMFINGPASYCPTTR